MEILEYPHPILLRRIQPIKNFNKSLSKTAEDLFKTMVNSGGVGLAANQVGILERMFVTSEIEERVICNPHWVPVKYAKLVPVLEGCLSFPGWLIPTKRYNTIWIEFQNIRGQRVCKVVSDLAAQVFQHEHEHLNGYTIINRLPENQRNTLINYFNKRST